MIVFDLECRSGAHRFEGWFASSTAYDEQQGRGLVSCPECGSPDVGKALSAPRLSRKGNQLAAAPHRRAKALPPEQAPAPEDGGQGVVAGGKLAPEAVAVLQKLARMQAAAISQSRWVGDSFAEDARAMHYGEQDAEPIYGQATADEARDLIEEGVVVAPLLFPVAAPDEIN